MLSVERFPNISTDRNATLNNYKKKVPLNSQEEENPALHIRSGDYKETLIYEKYLLPFCRIILMIAII